MLRNDGNPENGADLFHLDTEWLSSAVRFEWQVQWADIRMKGRDELLNAVSTPP